MCLLVCLCFFFKQKTAYEMRISDWSSDVCSSDLLPKLESLSHNADDGIRHFSGTATYTRTIDVPAASLRKGRRVYLDLGRVEEIGRASCRERVCQYV